MTPVSRVANPRHCSIAGALDVVGEKWSLLVVRELFFGVRRFSEIAVNTGAPRDILTTRLRRLEDAGVIERSEYSNRPLRYEYRLTHAGRDLLPVIMALKQWGDRHVSGQALPPFTSTAAARPSSPGWTARPAVSRRTHARSPARPSSTRRVHEGALRSVRLHRFSAFRAEVRLALGPGPQVGVDDERESHLGDVTGGLDWSVSRASPGLGLGFCGH